MRRRAFVAIAAAVAIRPAVVLAQQAKFRTIGVLVIGKPDPAPLLQTFRDQLATLGYVDGQNVRSASPHLHVAHPHCPRI